MAIVINGSGTVTGISVGGLPDDIVDAGMMADNSIDSDSYVDASIDAAHLASGVGGGSNFFFISTASQTGVSDNTWTKATLGTETLDTGSVVATSRFTVPVGGAGKYLILGSLMLTSAGTANGASFSTAIYKNGAVVAMSENNMADNYVRTMSKHAMAFLDLAEADYIELYGKCNTIDSGDVQFDSSGTGSNFLTGAKLG